MKDDDIAQLSDQVMDATALLIFHTCIHICIYTYIQRWRGLFSLAAYLIDHKKVLLYVICLSAAVYTKYEKNPNRHGG